MTEHQKLDVAMELLNDALIKHCSNSTPYSALHLSGATEEILGGYVKIQKEHTSFQEFHQAALEALGYNNENSSGQIFKTLSKAISDNINYEKNNVKHGHGSFKADIRMVTEESLDRAIANLYKLKESYNIDESQLIKSFKNRVLVEILLEDEEYT